MEKGLTRNEILSELSKSPHGKLNEYIPVGLRACKQEPEFFAHLIAWDHKKGQIRDAKAALPIVSLLSPDYPADLAENSLAHLAKLSPRELNKAYRFALEQKMKSSHLKGLNKFVGAYLHNSEENWRIWDRIAIVHRHTLKELYALTHTKPKSERVNVILFGRDFEKKKQKFPKTSIFQKVADLSNMSETEAAGTILEYKIPFLIAIGAIGKKMKDSSDLVLALIKRMSHTELVTNVKMLEQFGMKNNPALKGAFDEAVTKAATSTKNVLKTTRAAEQVKDESLKNQLRGLQDKQLASMAVEGNWLILGDRSTSMTEAIELARQVAATLAKMVKGKVWLTFFNTAPQTIDVTGAALDHIQAATRYINASGGTSIGCGLQRMMDEKIELDGIAIVSDAQENATPWFADVYKKYSKMIDKEVPVYLYRTKNLSNYGGDRDLKQTMNNSSFDLQEFDLTNATDYYSLPNLVSTMRTNRYSLIDEIMNTPLLSLAEVFEKEKESEKVFA